MKSSIFPGGWSILFSPCGQSGISIPVGLKFVGSPFAAYTWLWRCYATNPPFILWSSATELLQTHDGYNPSLYLTVLTWEEPSIQSPYNGGVRRIDSKASAFTTRLKISAIHSCFTVEFMKPSLTCLPVPLLKVKVNVFKPRRRLILYIINRIQVIRLFLFFFLFYFLSFFYFLPFSSNRL